MRVILLDTRTRVQAFRQFTRAASTRRWCAGELFREPCVPTAQHYRRRTSSVGRPLTLPEDVAITKDIVTAGKLLSIEVLDHLVIGATAFCEPEERGLGFG